ncbi:ribosomal L7Ae/L30e/S12e/Gadd45 family protein [Cohnella faecalis]
MSDDNERLRIAGRERQDWHKQTIKTVEQGDAAEVFVAQDADPVR